jgi:hypothetical protein
MELLISNMTMKVDRIVCYEALDRSRTEEDGELIFLLFLSWIQSEEFKVKINRISVKRYRNFLLQKNLCKFQETLIEKLYKITTNIITAFMTFDLTYNSTLSLFTPALKLDQLKRKFPRNTTRSLH